MMQKRVVIDESENGRSAEYRHIIFVCFSDLATVGTRNNNVINFIQGEIVL